MLEENKLGSAYFMPNHFKDGLGGAKKMKITGQKRYMAEHWTFELSHSFDQEHHHTYKLCLLEKNVAKKNTSHALSFCSLWDANST